MWKYTKSLSKDVSLSYILFCSSREITIDNIVDQHGLISDPLFINESGLIKIDSYL